MDDTVIRLRAFCEEYTKIASENAPPPKDKTQESGVYHDVVRRFPRLAEKKAGLLGAAAGGLRRFGEQLHKHEDAIELAGLGALAVPGIDTMQAHFRAGPGASEHQVAQKRLLGENAHAGVDVAGLGVLAAPIIAGKLLGKKLSAH